MTDADVVVVVPSELETGFGLAGVRTIGVDTAQAAEEVASRLMAEALGGVIAVYEPFLTALTTEERAKLEASTYPVVVPLPAGIEERDVEGHRARISAMLSRAVGYHITFGEEGPR